MAAYLTDDQATAAVAAFMKVNADALPDNFAEIVPEAHATAVAQLASFAAARGFTAGPPAAWAAGPGYERDLTVYWAAVKGAGLFNYDDRWTEKLNRWKELQGVTITDSSGAVITPTGTETAVGYGKLNEANDRLKLSDIRF
jgi:hypothetical protein